ncbi:MAG: 2OG-Fe(II) oxygenase [Pseudomonadota bacterium]
MTAVIPPIVRDPFPPGRSEPCFCGNGLRFKRCCGQLGMFPGRPVPFGIGIVEHFVSNEDCDALCEHAAECSANWLEVVDVEKSTAEQVVRRMDDRRVTERVNMGEHQVQLDRWMRAALEQVIEPAVQRTFEWYEQPQLLKYSKGGLYQGHADSDNYNPDRDVWQKELDRDISLLIYLSDDYEGGSLYFQHFDYTLQPRKGMLVYFPSDVRYKHEAQPVTAGLRYAVVSWAAFRDEPRVQAQSPHHSIFMQPS